MSKMTSEIWNIDNAVTYNRAVREIPSLDPDTTRELALRKNFDPEAREKLITANLRLVLYVLRSVNSRGVDYMDLVQAGNTGLIRGIDKYDPVSYDTALSTCVIPWIQQEVSRYIRNTCSSIRIPIETARDIDKLAAFRTNYYNEHLFYPDDEICAKNFGWSVKKVKNYLTWSTPISSLDAVYGEDNDGKTFGDTIASPNQDASSNTPLAPDSYEQVLNRELLDQAMKVLTPREADVLKRRFGLDGFGGATLGEIAEEIHLTRESIRQIQNKALGKLRVCLEGNVISAGRGRKRIA